MGKGLFKIYVGNLDYKVTEFSVRRLFEPFGDLEDVAMATDKETGKPRGFAIVMMRDHTEGNSAIHGVQGRRLMGRPLVVNEAVQKKGGKNSPKIGPPDSVAAQLSAGTATSSVSPAAPKANPLNDGPSRTPGPRSSGRSGGQPSNRNPRRSGGRNPRRSS
jgi:RNA recognition motif-containing protein